MVNDLKLLPCPFCGGCAEFRRSLGDTGMRFWVECLKCRAGGTDGCDKGDAAELWNRRNTGRE